MSLYRDACVGGVLMAHSFAFFLDIMPTVGYVFVRNVYLRRKVKYITWGIKLS